MYKKVIILGSGPAGCTAAIYAARANLNPLIITGPKPGGQLTITQEVENFPGFIDPILGPQLMYQMRIQAEKSGTIIIEDTITSVDLKKRPFKLTGENGTVYETDALIIATGAEAKWLGIESENKYRGFGVSACATCDGFFFKNKKVAVIGGGNTAAEEALYLADIASEVTIIHRRDHLRAEKVLQERIKENNKINIIWNSEIAEIIGQDSPKKVTNINIRNILNNSISTINIDGVFVAIGYSPSTELFTGQLDIDEFGYIKTTPGKTNTSVNGVFAAGDVADFYYRQAITAAGQGCAAAIDVMHWFAG